jgi:hypothetical protein
MCCTQIGAGLIAMAVSTVGLMFHSFYGLVAERKKCLLGS